MGDPMLLIDEIELAESDCHTVLHPFHGHIGRSLSDDALRLQPCMEFRIRGMPLVLLEHVC